MKPFLVEVLSREQFEFLKNQQILKVVGITQEVLHSIKLKRLEALVLNMDLIKAYDRVNWIHI